PVASEVLGGLVPRLPGSEALYIAIGIIGATVMPHNLYLHSALVQTRKIQKGDSFIRQALKLNFLDSAIALNLAFFVNAAILVLAATVFFKTGRTEVASIKEAHQLLAPLLGSAFAPKLFAIALIAAGQSSTVTGTLSGQIVMEGYLQLRINPILRRLMTRLLAIIPAVLVIVIAGENEVDNLLVLSQVILSLQLGFAIIPLIHFVSDKKAMGKFAINGMTKILSWTVAAILLYLNVKLVFEEGVAYIAQPGNMILKIIIIIGTVCALGLLVYVLVHPWIARQMQHKSIEVHGRTELLANLQAPEFRKIAVALDFGDHDQKLLSYAIGQGTKDSLYVLLHVVE
ncbi:MAG TPA: Nramp family divalent metal transporter, partial [Puia sp.]|nr:Nramp family divalent metal transporter [Puia sp.]